MDDEEQQEEAEYLHSILLRPSAASSDASELVCASSFAPVVCERRTTLVAGAEKSGKRTF